MTSSIVSNKSTPAGKAGKPVKSASKQADQTLAATGVLKPLYPEGAVPSKKHKVDESWTPLSAASSIGVNLTTDDRLGHKACDAVAPVTPPGGLYVGPPVIDVRTGLEASDALLTVADLTSSSVAAYLEAVTLVMNSRDLSLTQIVQLTNVDAKLNKDLNVYLKRIAGYKRKCRTQILTTYGRLIFNIE